MPVLSICVASIVVYRNDKEMIRRVATSYLNAAGSGKLYVVDNAMFENSRDALDGLPVEYLPNPINSGYGRGHNLALSQAEPSRYYLILNPDIFIPEHTVSALIQFMDENPDVGLVCPKVLFPDGTIQYAHKREPTILDLFLRRFLPARLRPLFRRRLERYEMQDVPYDTVFDVPFVTGAFMMCRRHVLERVGGFDPRYFMYFEDADLSRKIQQMGYRTVCYPHVVVVHAWERASHKGVRMALVLVANGYRFFRKWGWRLY